MQPFVSSGYEDSTTSATSPSLSTGRRRRFAIPRTKVTTQFTQNARDTADATAAATQRKTGDGDGAGKQSLEHHEQV